jgi:hypothetical protein
MQGLAELRHALVTVWLSHVSWYNTGMWIVQL